MIKNKFLFYFLSLTWGLPMTLIGLCAGLVLLIMGNKPTKHGYCLHFRVGQGWGGVNFGLVFITCHDTSQHTMDHEHGHAHQNCILGPLFPFVVAVPSAIRYWMFRLNNQNSKRDFAEILCVCLVFIGYALTFIPLLAFSIIGYALIVYAAILAFWLFIKEIPKYEFPKLILYDDIWFEGGATRVGTEFMNWYNTK